MESSNLFIPYSSLKCAQGFCIRGEGIGVPAAGPFAALGEEEMGGGEGAGREAGQGWGLV